MNNCNLLALSAEIKEVEQSPIPVFIISYNRTQMLQRCVASIEALDTSLKLIIYDNGSDREDTLNALDHFERRGISVHRSSRINSPEDLNLMADFIQDHCSAMGPATPYIVTDSDIDLSSCRKDIVKVLQHMLAHFPKAECAGPMLRISDVPREHPVWAHIYNRHIDQFWHKLPSFVNLPSGLVAFQRAHIDTTFALHRGGLRFYRPRLGIRVYKPYEALHLDWYPRCWEIEYSHSSSAMISHWSNPRYIQEHQTEKLAHNQYYDVIYDEKVNVFTVVDVELE
jgi:hypothetical protein